MSPRLETDHDRDEAQDEPRHRGQGVRAALLALVVTGLVVGSWWAGHRSSPSTQEAGAVPVIHPDAGPVKEAPKDPGGMVVPGQDSVLLNHDAKGKPEELLPPPETVKLRPAPPSPPPQSADTNAPPPVAPAVNVVPPVPQVGSPAPAVSTPPAPQVAVAPPAPVAPPASAAKAALAPPTGGSYRLQLGALKTEEAAKAEWLKLQRQNSDVLGKLSLSVSRVELGAKGTYYRIQAGPIPDAEKATQACAALTSRKIGCILVKP